MGSFGGVGWSGGTFGLEFWTRLIIFGDAV